MEIEIEQYRGYEIRFNTEKETFVCDIDDERSVKKSFSAIKKFIDDFIKDNDTFKEFKVIKSLNSSWGKEGIINIIGIRKDGRLVGMQNGEKFQISDYELDKYSIYDSSKDDIRKEIKKLELDFDEANKLYRENRSKLVQQAKEVSLKDYKKQLTK